MLGVGIVGAGAGELIAEGVLAIEMGATREGPRADHPSAPDALRDGDGIGGSVLRYQARMCIGPSAISRSFSGSYRQQHSARFLAGTRQVRIESGKRQSDGQS